MKVTIAQRLRPFSHQPGVVCPIPLSSWAARVFPARIELSHLGKFQLHHIFSLNIQGPVKDFTVELDLEKGCVRVFGTTAVGYMHYEIHRSIDGIQLFCKRAPENRLSFRIGDDEHHLEDQTSVVIPVSPESLNLTVPITRLSLGMHKSQDWDLVKRRGDLKEIFPVFLRLGSMIPSTKEQLDKIGTMQLLQECIQFLEKHKKLDLMVSCQKWLQVAFSGILTPQLLDIKFQGIIPLDETIPINQSTLPLLSYGSQMIQQMFFLETFAQWEVLPCLLPPFAAGRLTDLLTTSKEIVSIEWAKHQLRKMIVQTAASRTIQLKLPKEVRSCRIKKKLKDRGQIYPVQDSLLTLNFPENTTLYFDRFMR